MTRKKTIDHELDPERFALLQAAAALYYASTDETDDYSRAALKAVRLLDAVDSASIALPEPSEE